MLPNDPIISSEDCEDEPVPAVEPEPEAAPVEAEPDAAGDETTPYVEDETPDEGDHSTDESDETAAEEVVNASIFPEPVAATFGDGSEPPAAPDEPFVDPYDIPNPDEDVDESEDPEPEEAPDFEKLGGVQDMGDDPDAD